jgi:hypothetical protein
MQDAQPPLPSTRALLLSLGVAALLAALVLVTLVLPAEYGVDPSGIGAAIGLTRLSQSEELTEVLDNPDAAETGGLREDTTTIEIEPGTDLEYKLRIGAGSLLEYEWKTDGGTLFAELHGEPAGDTSGYYEDFAVGHATDLKGSLEPPFEGTHGWLWRNENPYRVTVTLKTRGVYEVVGRLEAF